jgi:two-component system response regulator VicR
MTSLNAFTTGQAATICGVSVRTLKRWLQRGDLNGYRLPSSGEWRIPRPELVGFMLRHGIPLGPLEAAERRRVLMVGEEPALRQVRQEVLDRDPRLEVEAFHAGDYAACLNVGLRRPDLIVLDLSGDHDDCLQLARAIRENPDLKGAKILFTSGCDRPECLADMERLGDAHLLQPVRAEAILELIYRLAGLPPLPKAPLK